MRFLILGRSVGLKKKRPKKIFFLYAVTMLIFQIERIISSEKWCNYVVTFFFFSFFFFEIAKNLDRSDDGKRRKKMRMTFDKMI